MVAQYGVVPELERRNPRLFRIGSLQRGDDAAAVVAEPPNFVERGIEAGGDEAAIACEDRQVTRQGFLQIARQGGEFGLMRWRYGLAGLRKLRGQLIRSEARRCAVAGLEPISQRREIARSATLEGEPCERARQVACGAQFSAQARALLWVRQQVRDSVVATRKDEKLEHQKLLVVQVHDHNNRPKEQYVVAVDAVGAGHEDMVLYATGSSARQTAQTEGRPCDAVIMAVVDSWDLGGENVYEKWA